MSTYSSSSQDSYTFSSPQYHYSTPSSMDDPRNLSQADKHQLIHSLRTHKVNTITELRRIEKVFAYLDSQEFTGPMTSAWQYYVNSHQLLNELRGLTRNYPFSSELLDEAKVRVIGDPSSVRSWNFCWLILVKIEQDNLIVKHARNTAVKPSMWGHHRPTSAECSDLANALVHEWTRAVRTMLRHWETPPSTTGY